MIYRKPLTFEQRKARRALAQVRRPVSQLRRRLARARQRDHVVSR